MKYGFFSCLQPLTDFSGNKCKRCGFYEEDTIKSDDVFDEWEFCPSDFMATKGKYTREKEKEFKATFLCPDCKSVASCEFFVFFTQKLFLFLSIFT